MPASAGISWSATTQPCGLQTAPPSTVLYARDRHLASATMANPVRVPVKWTADTSVSSPASTHRAPPSLVPRIVPLVQNTFATVAETGANAATDLHPVSVAPVGETTSPFFGSMYHSSTGPASCFHVAPPFVGGVAVHRAFGVGAHDG